MPNFNQNILIGTFKDKQGVPESFIGYRIWFSPVLNQFAITNENDQRIENGLFDFNRYAKFEQGEFIDYTPNSQEYIRKRMSDMGLDENGNPKQINLPPSIIEPQSLTDPQNLYQPHQQQTYQQQVPYQQQISPQDQIQPVVPPTREDLEEEPNEIDEITNVKDPSLSLKRFFIIVFVIALIIILVRIFVVPMVVSLM